MLFCSHFLWPMTNLLTLKALTQVLNRQHRCACVCMSYVLQVFDKYYPLMLLTAAKERSNQEKAFKRFFHIYFFIYIFENVSNRKTFIIWLKKSTEQSWTDKIPIFFANWRFCVSKIGLKVFVFGWKYFKLNLSVSFNLS